MQRSVPASTTLLQSLDRHVFRVMHTDRRENWPRYSYRQIRRYEQSRSMMSQRLALSIELIDVSSLELSRRNFFFEEVVDLVECSILGLGQSEDCACNDRQQNA